MKKKTLILFGIPAGIIFLFFSFLLGWFWLANPGASAGSAVGGRDLSDGVYEGHYRNGPNRAHVKVTVESGRIAHIEVIKNVASWIGKDAVPAIPNRIIAEQSTDVDAVTGATHSSVVIMNAVEDAIRKSHGTGR